MISTLCLRKKCLPIFL